MRLQRGSLAALVVLATASAVGLPTAAMAETGPDIQITEFEYNTSEFVELTNVGDAAQDFAGWSFDDVTGVPGSFSLSGFGTVAPGESVIVTDSTADAFRALWGLTADVKVVGGNTQGLGNGDAITVFDAGGTLVDSLAYPGDKATAQRSGHVAADGLAVTTASYSASGPWTLSAVGDTEGSWEAGEVTVDGVAVRAVGSPGASTLGSRTPDDVRGPSGGDGGDGDTPPVDPTWANVSINEVSSDNADDVPGLPFDDPVELYNAGDTAVDLSTWTQIDGSSSAPAPFTSTMLVGGAPATVIPAHGYAVFGSTKGLGSGGDGVRLYAPDGSLVDEVSYGAGRAGGNEGPDYGAAAYAACPDGSGAFVTVGARSLGGSNASACATSSIPVDDSGTPTLACQPEGASGSGPATPGATTWPGGSSVTVADAECAWRTLTGPEGRDVSGLVFDSSNPGVLWAVKNKSWVFRLVKQDGLWVADATGGWAAGKQVFFPGGVGQPDTEGITQGPGGALYVTTERDNDANDVALNSVLQLDPSAPTLTAVRQWDLTADFPELRTGSKTEANLGFEGLTFVPDSYLVAKGFVDQSTGTVYRPAAYPLHGSGVFFTALENDGKLYAYVLNSDQTAHRIAVVDTGMGHVMDVQYDAALQRIWALCDNTCDVTSTVLGVNGSGYLTPDAVYARPAALPAVNVEGFAVAPAATCAGGVREAVWSDDGISAPGHEGHALYSGTLRCGLDLGAQGIPAWSSGTVYDTGDVVQSGGRVWSALWWTRGEVPGTSRSGAWEEIATAADGTAIWTATRVFDTGDVVLYQGTRYTALWWLRGTVPGSGNGWQPVLAPGSPYRADAIYYGGETVTYQGHTYRAQWWTQGVAPGGKHSAWLLVG